MMEGKWRSGDKFGVHRVIDPRGRMPQAAYKLNNSMEIYDNEILIDVDALNIDSASFTQLRAAYADDVDQIKQAIMEIVHERGKMQNPVTGSGGMLIGTVLKIGPKFPREYCASDLKVGDRIATLVSLTLTPLYLEKIKNISLYHDRVDVKGKAILFESGIYAKIPPDIPESAALAAFDIAGAPAQTAHLVKPGYIVLILGAGGKSGICCAYMASKIIGNTGRVIGVDVTQERLDDLKALGYCTDTLFCDAKNPIDIYRQVMEITGNCEVDLSINCLNIPDTEMATILPVKNKGVVYFFSMATSFTKAALGAEGVGKDATMIIGNGYTEGHADCIIKILQDSPYIREILETNGRK